MITCQLIGGLGNQLFQIATTLALAWDNQDQAVFDLNGHIKLSQGNEAICYRAGIYRNLIDRPQVVSKCIFKERGHHYQPIPYHPSMKLIGFFQSEKYFIKYRQNLLDILSPTSQIIDKLTSKHKFILERPNCAIHVRRGDYLNRSQYNPVCSIEYYKTAIELFDDDTQFLVFSDDLEWCKHNFNILAGSLEEHKFIFSEHNSEETDLYLMSMCQHQIIANSTFSWWGSWLNQNPLKKTVAPKIWFGSALQHLNTEDIYVESTLIL